MEKAELRQRITDRLAILGKGPVEAAAQVDGLERNFIRDFLEGKKNSFSAAKMPLVARALGWTVAELQGTSPKRTSRHSPRITMVPLLDRASAVRLKNTSSQVPMDDAPLLAFADLGTGDFFALEVNGDSMDRFSPEGSIIVINKSERELISGCCYVFAHKDDAIYRIWRGGDNPHLAPYSTNPLNEPIFFRRRELEVIGRVKRTVLDL
jgi:SOS-response transcriptional repressor LexA